MVTGASAAPVARRSHQASIWPDRTGDRPVWRSRPGSRGCPDRPGGRRRRTCGGRRDPGRPGAREKTRLLRSRTRTSSASSARVSWTGSSPLSRPATGRGASVGRRASVPRRMPIATAVGVRRSGRDARHPTAAPTPSPAAAPRPATRTPRPRPRRPGGSPAWCTAQTSAPGSSPPPDAARPSRPAPTRAARSPRARSAGSAPGDGTHPCPRRHRPAHPAPMGQARRTTAARLNRVLSLPKDRGQPTRPPAARTGYPSEAQGPVRGEPKLLQRLPGWWRFA